MYTKKAMTPSKIIPNGSNIANKTNAVTKISIIRKL